MSEGSNWCSCDRVQEGISLPDVIHFEGKDTVDIRKFELGGKSAVGIVLKIDSDVRIQHSEFELHIIGSEGNPSSTIPLLNNNGVFNIFLDRICGRCSGLVDSVMLYIGCS